MGSAGFVVGEEAQWRSRSLEACPGVAVLDEMVVLRCWSIEDCRLPKHERCSSSRRKTCWRRDGYRMPRTIQGATKAVTKLNEVEAG